jgi:hypothetical protein
VGNATARSPQTAVRELPIFSLQVHGQPSVGLRRI